MLKQYYVLVISLLLTGGLSGCQPPVERQEESEYLLKVNESSLTVKDFNRALDIAKTAYPYELFSNTQDDEYKTSYFKLIQIELLKQLTERLILMERAREINLSISAEELNQATARIKDGYPDDAFEAILIEYAVSYSVWEAELKNRLLLEKLIEKEISDNIVITPEEVEEHIRTHAEPEPMDEAQRKEMERLVLLQLKQKKTEEQYRAWIEELRQRYTISVNSESWKKLTDS